MEPDIIVVAAFGQIIPKSILELPKYGCINIHASLLPKYRGAAPIQQAVIDGEKESGVTIMRMGTGLDTGDMISKIVVPIAKDETGGTLFDKLAEAGAKLLVETLPHIFDGTAVYEKQPEESPTPYAGMITKQMGLINFGKSAEELERLVRGLNPWPSAFTFWNGKTLKVWESFVVKSEEAGAEKSEPGTVVKTDKKEFNVACGEGCSGTFTGTARRKKENGCGCIPSRMSYRNRSRFTVKRSDLMYGYGYPYGFYVDPTYVLLIIGMVLALAASGKMKSTFGTLSARCAAIQVLQELRLPRGF